MNQEYSHAPHRRGVPSEEHSLHAALLIDFDNVTMGIRSNLGTELRKLLDSDVIRGKVSVQRAYADWRRYPQYIVPLSEASIDLIFAPAYGSSKKNATDIRLAIDALEIVFTRPEIGTFILLSGDSDFSSLVLKLKEYGKYVIGVGLQESSSDILVQNCDEYYSYNSLSGLTAAADMEQERLDPWELAERAVAKMVERGDVMRSDRMKQVMLELDPTFDEKSAGFSKFNRFLAEAAHREIVLLRKAPNGQYEVAPGRPASESSEQAQPEPPPRRKTGARSRRGSSRAASRSQRGPKSEATPPAETEAPPTDEGQEGASETRAERHAAEVHRIHKADLKQAYDMLRAAVDNLASDRESVRDSEVKRKLIASDKGFDEGAIGFRKFSRFLVQARDEGIIDLEQGEDGNFYVSLPEEPGPTGEPAAGTEAREADTSAAAGRGRRGDRRGRGRGARAGRRTEPEPAEEVETAAEPEPAEEAETAAEAGTQESVPAEASVEPEETARSGEPEGGARRRRGLGRFRRGSRGRPSSQATGPRLGPIPESAEPASGAPSEGVEREEGEEEGAPQELERESAARTAASSSRGLGRFRGGSRGREALRSPEGAQAAGGAPETARAEPTSSDAAGDGPAAQAVEHMVRSYPGVGRRTAERLTQEFGSRVFEVIDREPERVFAVLTENRAQAVVDGRKAEKSASEGS